MFQTPAVSDTINTPVSLHQLHHLVVRKVSPTSSSLNVTKGTSVSIVCRIEGSDCGSVDVVHQPKGQKKRSILSNNCERVLEHVLEHVIKCGYKLEFEGFNQTTAWCKSHPYNLSDTVLISIREIHDHLSD